MTLALAAPSLEIVSAVVPMMGGSVGVHLRPGPDPRIAAATTDLTDPACAVGARRDAELVLRRIAAWADRLTRFTTTSDLARLNAARSIRVPIRPTLGSVIDWGRAAEGLTDGIVDIALLDARLAAERPDEPFPLAPGPSAASRRWKLQRGRRSSLVERSAGLRFDLDGVAKGWLADRALGRLDGYPAAVVDADGDIAIRLGVGERWGFGVADPRAEGTDLAILELAAGRGAGEGWFGLATSGTSIHRWVHDGRLAHHLIDPRTGRPARTDVVQATVLARSAREAEALAKTAVILGSAAALARLDRPGIDGALLLTDRDELLLTPSTLRWLA